jgi:high-affinity iron transporter
MLYPDKLLRLRRLYLFALCLIVISVLVRVSPILAQQLTPAERLRSLAHMAREGVEAAQQNQVTLMQAEYNEIHELWETFEDEIRQQDTTAYVELEGALHGVKEALQAEPLDPIATQLAYDHLMEEANEVATRFDGVTAETPTAVEATPAELLDNFNAAYLAVERGNAAEAAEQLADAVRAWPAVEGVVATRSQEAYTAIEIDLSRATAALKTEPVDLAGAEAALGRLRQNLTPFVSTQKYTVFDAAAIILREGLEALLIIVALLAFLRRSGHSHQRVWVWFGGGLGVLASIIAAFVLQTIFSQATAGQNREVIEGVTGLIAAGLLFYVSYWLHSKANLRAWQKYIDARTGQALRRGSVAGLAFLAFLSVFREGAETTVFYLGMAPAISVSDLLLGLGLGSAGLVLAAFLILVIGVKLPLRLFFQVAGLLVYYLGFKFLGTGLHALQVAGILPASPVVTIPAVPFAGVYPTWETLVPQLLLLAVALGVFLYLRNQNQPKRTIPPAVTT